MRGLAAFLLLTFCVPASAIELHPRTRVETSKGSGRYHAIANSVDWDAKKTAVVVCDMWDKHWCPDSTKRVGEMAPRMNEVLKAARSKGMLIIHCPSDTMGFYKDTPGRKLAQSAPVVKTEIPLEPWCRLDKDKEIALPIDDSDGGCDTPVKNYKAWSRQIATLEIMDGDGITDSAEAYYLMKQKGIENVIVMGVHTNMCVLGRPFAIRQLVRQGMNVVLMRDMTDTMYNPKAKPFVSHFTGTDLVVEHIERHWCPSITSADFLGGDEFRFPDDKRPRMVMLIGEDEYKTETTLPEFAATELGKYLRVSFVFSDDRKLNEFPGAEAIKNADALLISVRRRAMPKVHLDLIRQHIAMGKPIIGIRTASHAFEPKTLDRNAGQDQWVDFDGEVLGGNYTGHHGANIPTFAIIDAEIKHPILTGIAPGEWKVGSSLYKSAPLKSKAVPIAFGRAEKVETKEPIAWTYTNEGNGRVFYTSLGHVDDFKIPGFRKLLRNGILWAVNVPIPE